MVGNYYKWEMIDKKDIKLQINEYRVGNMGRARLASPNWPDILEGQAVKLAT